MQKKNKLIKKTIIIMLIILILISTMPYKPKISNKAYSADVIKTMAQERIGEQQNISEITINKVDSKTEEALEGVEFELTPIEENIIDNMTPVKTYTVSYFDSGYILATQDFLENSVSMILSCGIQNLKGWALEKDSDEVVYLPDDAIVVNKDIKLYAVKYKLQSFQKDIVESPPQGFEDILSSLPKITYPNASGEVEFTNENPEITLLYEIKATGDPGFEYRIIDERANYVFGDPLEGTIPNSGKISVYVTRTFSEYNIKANGNLENVAKITPGIESNLSTSSIQVPAVNKILRYTVTYTDGVADETIFEDQTCMVMAGAKTPEFEGTIEAEGFEFVGWSPPISDTVENNQIYTAQWIKSAALTEYIGERIENTIQTKDDDYSYEDMKTLKNTDLPNNQINTLSNDAVLDTSVNQTYSLLNSFSNEKMAISNQNTYDYTFIKSEDGTYKSNNQGKSSREALAFLPIDLSTYVGTYTVEVNASISSEQNFDYGYARLVEYTGSEFDYTDRSSEFINMSGTIENDTYRVTLEGGKKYRILFGYYKDSSVDEGEDTFTINSVKLILNSEGLNEKITLQTDSIGKIIIDIPDGRYILTETNTIEGYKVLEYPIIIEVHNNEINILENKNTDEITIINQNELKILNTTSRVIVHYYIKTSDGNYTQIKLKDDEILKGIEGTRYEVEPLLIIEKEGLSYELEYEIENGTKKYNVPENNSGNFGKEDIDVNYYYQIKKQIIINKLWIDNDNSLGIRPDSISVKLTATVENENGKIVEYPIKNMDTTVTLRSNNGSENGDNWTYTWSNLENYDENGKEIMYCVEEIQVPEEYYSVVSFIDYEHYEITNYKSGSIKIIKVDSKDNNIKLGGAEFKLERLTENNGEIVIDEYFEPIILTTSTEEETLGEATFKYLEYGKYRLTEIKAPNGYSLQNNTIDIEITEENPDCIEKIINKEKNVLPDTGGNGSVILTMVGVFLIAIAIKIK